MIRYVAYRKAVVAGMAGAVAWEAVARPFILAGVPFVDIVGTLGGVALPHASVWASWTVGMLLHLIVGAIWAVFYAYFFWSLLPLRPVLQGLVFAFVPMPLAIFVMHPQLELMQPLIQSGRLPFTGMFGLPGGWHEPASIGAGHLIWGAVLGALYARPVGYAVGEAPVLGGGRKAPSCLLSSAREPDRGRFMFATGIECSYPTLEGGRWRMDQMAACG